jgi:hypothetical protein
LHSNDKALDAWQNALHKENSGFAAPTLGRHISRFHGYQILFSIRNPYINRFTNHFYIHSNATFSNTSAIFGNLQSRARTHAVLVIGLYELLGNQTT